MNPYCGEVENRVNEVRGTRQLRRTTGGPTAKPYLPLLDLVALVVESNQPEDIAWREGRACCRHDGRPASLRVL